MIVDRNIDEIAAAVVAALPALDRDEQRLSLTLYRLLARNRPVPMSALANDVGAAPDAVATTLASWPGVFMDSDERIIGFWGLSIEGAYPSPHELTTDGRTLSAWCAWDTLFLPQLLGAAAVVRSTSPAGEVVRLVVTPDEAAQVRPADAHMSFIVPKAEAVKDDVVTAFCHFVHFFPTRAACDAWTADHPGSFTLSVAEASALARRKNALQFRQVLR